jgi:4-amino-4-deoxy-L-arabinose transferase-like glycosyltransferase
MPGALAGDRASAGTRGGDGLRYGPTCTSPRCRPLARRERAILVSLAFYVFLWTAYGTIAKSSQGFHPDMAAVIAWSRDLSLGYVKHPPFAAWLVRVWFTIFPIAGWSYYLLAMLMPAVTLWIVWRMSADYLDADKRVVGIVLLTFVPFFNFHALKYNVNTVLLPLWAATTWCRRNNWRHSGNGANAPSRNDCAFSSGNDRS